MRDFDPKHTQFEPLPGAFDECRRDLNAERGDFQRMIARQSEASQEYTRGKLKCPSSEAPQ